MGDAQRLGLSHASQAPHSRCLASPHCGLPASVSRRFGGLDGLWLHYGPIGEQTTPLMLHRAERAPSDQNRGGLEVETCRDWRRHEGDHLDLFCVDHCPGPGAARHTVTLDPWRAVVWRVYSIVWRDDPGPSIIWKAPGFGLRGEGWTQVSPDRQTAATSAELSRLEDLLAGGAARPGRPPRWRDPSWRDVTERAEQRKATYPSLPWDDIARGLGINPRTLRDYRRLLRREHGGSHELQVLEGGQA